jgi:glycerate-2-kinase
MLEPKSCGSGLERLKADSHLILESALDAVDPYKAVHSHVTREGRFLNVGAHRYDLQEVERVIVVGAGKASARMAVAISSLLIMFCRAVMLFPRTSGVISTPMTTA